MAHDRRAGEPGEWRLTKLGDDTYAAHGILIEGPRCEDELLIPKDRADGLTEDEKGAALTALVYLLAQHGDVPAAAEPAKAKLIAELGPEAAPMVGGENTDPNVGRCGYAQFEPVGNGPITPAQALEGISKIRDSIVGLQAINWSEHIYPLVALLNRAGYPGMGYKQARANYGTCLDQRNEAVEMVKLLLDRDLKPRPGQQPGDEIRERRKRAEGFLKRIGEDDPEEG